MYLGPLGPDPEERARIHALLPADREWLTRHGWEDPTKPYPTIGTEVIKE